jgi:hypothetical protein
VSRCDLLICLCDDCLQKWELTLTAEQVYNKEKALKKQAWDQNKRENALDEREKVLVALEKRSHDTAFSEAMQTFESEAQRQRGSKRVKERHTIIDRDMHRKYFKPVGASPCAQQYAPRSDHVYVDRKPFTAMRQNRSRTRRALPSRAARDAGLRTGVNRPTLKRVYVCLKECFKIDLVKVRKQSALMKGVVPDRTCC